jgi:hypothetical protein
MMMIKVSLGSVLYQRATRTMAQMRLTDRRHPHPPLCSGQVECEEGGEGWVTSTPSSTPQRYITQPPRTVGGGVMIVGDGGGRIYSQFPDMS